MNNKFDGPTGELLKSCHTALELCDKTQQLQRQELTIQGELIAKQSERITYLERNQPNKGFWFVLGAILTGLIVFLVKW